MKAIILKTDHGYYVEVPHSKSIALTDNLLAATMYEKKDKKRLHNAIEKLRNDQFPYRKMIMELTEI